MKHTLLLWWFLIAWSLTPFRVGPFATERQCIDYRGAVTVHRQATVFDCWDDGMDPGTARMMAHPVAP